MAWNEWWRKATLLSTCSTNSHLTGRCYNIWQMAWNPENSEQYARQCMYIVVFLLQCDINRSFLLQCEWAERMGVHMYYVVCNDKNHYVGGTSSGREFLGSNPHIPASFLISTKPGLLLAVWFIASICHDEMFIQESHQHFLFQPSGIVKNSDISFRSN